MPRCAILKCYDDIREDAFIVPATAGVPPGERPAVWFSVHPVWEPTATKLWMDAATRKLHTATREEMVAAGLVRIEVAPDAAPHRWRDYLRLSGVTPHHASYLKRAAREQGANVHHWRVSLEPVPIEQWLRVESWDGAKW